MSFYLGPDDEYDVPQLYGLTVAQARYEWTHRRRVRVLGRKDRMSNTRYYETVGASDDWLGFTGAITPGDAPDDAIVTGYSTDPPFTYAEPREWETWPEVYNARGRLHETATLHLFYVANLVTPDGDNLVTPTGDQLVTGI